jgi:biotin operon repressor
MTNFDDIQKQISNLKAEGVDVSRLEHQLHWARRLSKTSANLKQLQDEVQHLIDKGTN